MSIQKARRSATVQTPAAGADALRGVRTYPQKSVHRVIGLMTGTSADAVDAALVRFESGGEHPSYEIEHFSETPLEPALRREILEVASLETLPPERLMRLDAALGERFAAAVLELLASAGVSADAIDAVGSHGQTVRHVPRHAGGGQALTMQIGSSAVLAERTGFTVVSDFRARDTAAGGEGAPLVPLVDWMLFGSARASRGLLNLGGMANVTWLPKGGSVDDVIAFDTGPGNAVIDALVHFASDGADTHDAGGERAARGSVGTALLTELLTDPFFATPPPRSTGREHFGHAYAEKMRGIGNAMGLSDDDLIATAVELTARSVALAFESFLDPRGGVDEVYMSGGGTQNPELVRALEQALGGHRLRTCEALGVPTGAKEALAFAFLAHRTLLGAFGNVPSATGSARPVVLGHITPGSAA